MNPQKDAYGQEILAYLNKEPSYEVIEREDGFIGLSGGADNYFAGFKHWPKWQREGIKFAKGKVLDVGAGAGRVALYLQKKSLKVTAIENSPLAIQVCRKRGLKDARVLPIEEVGVFKPNTFDTVVMYGNNFGLFCNFKKAKILLGKLYKITTPDALIVAESNNPYETSDPVHLAYHKLNRRRGRMSGQARFRIRFRNYIGNWFDYLMVSREEMKSVLKDTGWRVKKFIGSGGHMYIAIIEKDKR